jgi:hypothetical protein
VRGCPPQTPPVGQGRTPGTRHGCAVGWGGGRGGGGDGEGRWRWRWRCMIFTLPAFSISRGCR